MTIYHFGSDCDLSGCSSIGGDDDDGFDGANCRSSGSGWAGSG